MATKKISQFTSLAQTDLDSAADVLAIVDTGSTETKKVTAKALTGGAVADLVAVWNNVATTFSAIKMDVTDTASAAGSFLLNLLVGGAARFQVTKAGAVTAASSIRSTSASASRHQSIDQTRSSRQPRPASTSLRRRSRSRAVAARE